MKQSAFVTATERIRVCMEIRPDGTVVEVDKSAARRPGCQYQMVSRTVVHAMPRERFLELAPVVV